MSPSKLLMMMMLGIILLLSSITLSMAEDSPPPPTQEDGGQISLDGSEGKNETTAAPTRKLPWMSVCQTTR